ncbi:T9SS type A sorting domain-containing protein [Fluviicola sp.]|uniref:T9SS type A sorting domain-containing protein n=1 Tax=Fluviicola sp. TaxID=1917219 RepID=UPI0031DD9BD2
MKNLIITLTLLSCFNLSFGQLSDTMALSLNMSSCGEAQFGILYYFENEDSINFHIDFGNNTDSTYLMETNFYSGNFVSSNYTYSGNYTVVITAETPSGTFLDQKTYSFAIQGGENCSQETIYKIRNDFSGPYLITDTIPIDFTGNDGITHTITSMNPNSYHTNPLLYPAQISASASWLATHNRVQLNPPMHFSGPGMISPDDLYYGLGWPAFIISRTDIPNQNNFMFSSSNSTVVSDQYPTDYYLKLNNTTDAIPDSANRIRVEYDPFLQVSHDTLLNMTEGTGYIEFDVELLNFYDPIHFALTASSVVSLDSIYFRCFYLNNSDQNAQDDTTTLYFESVDPCAGMTDSVLNISLSSVLTQYGNAQPISYLTLAKNMCEQVDSIGLTVHYSPIMEIDAPNSNFQFTQINDSTVHGFVSIQQYAASQYLGIPFILDAIPPGSVYVNYEIDIQDSDLTDNLIGDTLSFIACDSVDFTFAAVSAIMVAPLQKGTYNVSPLIISQCYLADSAEILITFPSYVVMDSTTLTLGTYTDSTFHLFVDWSNQHDYFMLSFDIPGTIPSGTPYTITAKIIGDNDVDSTNNEYIFNGTVLNSYDPNEKHADLPSALDPDLQEKITYTIHFQNDGNLEAYNIVVRDTLSPNLDLSTFEFLGASHACEVTVDENTREVIFNFPNIMLASSELDSLGSQGIFSYQISENADLPVGSVIENTAYIYFDFNPAIVTNTTHHINDSALGLNETTSENIVMYPNPAENRVQFSGALVKEVSIYDLAGKLVLEITNCSTNEISVEDLQTGIYQVVLKTENSVSTQKLAIKK